MLSGRRPTKTARISAGLVAKQLSSTPLVPGLDGLRNAALKLFDLKDEIDANAEECNRLIESAIVLTTDIVDGTADPRQQDAPELQRLCQVVHDIYAYIIKLKNDSQLVKAVHRIEVRMQLEAFQRQLEDAYSRYQVDLSRHQTTMLQKQTDMLESQTEMLGSVRTIVERLVVSERSPGYVLPPGPRPVPKFNLPPNPRFFCGRDDTLDAVVGTLLSSISAHIAILGTGGIGKTTLATRALYDSRVQEKFSDYRLFINCDGILSADGLVAAVASQFKVVSSEDISMQTALVAHLQSYETSILLVLDNLESSWDTDDQDSVEIFLTYLCNVECLSLIITMRGTRAPYGQDWTMLNNLPPLILDQARQLFLQIRGRTNEHDDSKLDELLQCVDGLPLAITLLASASNTEYSPSELLAAYEEEKTALLTKGRGKDRLSNLDISIMISLQSRTIQDNPNALELLKLVSLLPDGIHDDDLPSVLPSMKGSKPASRTLANAALCTHVNGVSRVLAPIRIYMLEHHPPTGAHLDELRDFYFQLALQGRDTAHLPFEKTTVLMVQLNNIQAVLSNAIHTLADETAVLAAITGLSQFSYFTGWGDCTALLEEAISTYTATTNAQSSVFPILIDCQRNLGNLLRKQGDFERAAKELTRAKLAFHKIGDRLREADCILGIGNIMRLQTDFKSAMLAFDEAKSLFQELGNALGVGQCMLSIGDMLWFQSDFDGSAAALAEAKTMLEEIGDRVGVARCIKSLGELSRIQDDFETAAVTLEDARSRFQQIGDRQGVAQCMQSLGNLLRMQQRYEEAMASLEGAKAIFKDSGDRWGMATCARILGDTLRMQEDYPRAIASLRESRTVFEDIGNRFGAAQCTRSLGDISRMEGHFDDAMNTLEKVKLAFQEIGDRHGVAQCLQILGNTMRMQQDYEGSIVALEQAKSICEAIGATRAVIQCERDIERTLRKEQQQDPVF